MIRDRWEQTLGNVIGYLPFYDTFFPLQPYSHYSLQELMFQLHFILKQITATYI